jgi:branched-chain amino acid transport system substrate-binding protein
MRNRLFLVLSILVIASMMLASCEKTPEFVCEDAIGCVDVAAGEPIHLAYLLVVSGANETLGIDSRNGVEIAITDKGQVLGHDILLTGEDGGCSAEGGQAAGTKLAADTTIVAVVGTSCSSEARVAVPLLSAAGFSIISPSNTAPDLTAAGNENNHPGYLRTAHNDTVQGAAAADFAYNSLGLRTAATIHDGSIYADKLQQVFAESFITLGGTITSQEAVSIGQTDMSPVLTRIASGAPEIIYFPIFLPEGGFIIRQARETIGLENTFLMGADGLFSPDVVEAAGASVEGFMVSSPDFTQFGSDYADKFVPAYEARYGQTPISIFHAHAYDAAMMIFAAIEQVAVQDEDGTLHIGRQALRDALYGMENFQGLTGNLTCTDTGDCADPRIAAYEYHADTYPPEKIWP